MGPSVTIWPENWHRSRLFRVLSLGGYVAFDLPKAVTGLGAVLLLGIAGTHVYVLTSQETLPGYFVIYASLAVAGCLMAAGSMAIGTNPHVAQLTWYFSDLLSVAFLGLVIGSRAVVLPDLVSVTGRWDFAPATFTLAFAAAFIALHASVLLGINVAFPQRQHWED